MSTQKQIEANRANAQLSTGPKTAEGKTASSQNATTHGLSSRHIFLPGENPEDWQKIRDNFRAHFQLEDSVIEDAFLDQATQATWRLHRIEEWMTMLVTSAFQLEPVPTPIALLFATDHQTAMRRLERYEASARASLNRALTYLRAAAAQRERAKAEAREAARKAEEEAAMAAAQAGQVGAESRPHKTNPISDAPPAAQTLSTPLLSATRPDNLADSQ